MSVDRQLVSTALACVLLMLLVMLLPRVMAPGSAEAIAVAGNTIVACFAGGVILSTAAALAKGEALRTRWAVIGFGVVLFVIGELLVGYYLIVAETAVPYPGIPDAFFVASRLAFAIGLIDAALGVRRLGSAVAPLVMSLVVCLALLAISAGVLSEMVVDPTIPPLEKALDLYRPLAGIFLGVLPALMVVFAVALKGGRLGWPWVPIAIGMIALSLGDIVFSWLTWADAYRPGGITDALWIAGYALFAMGALTQSAVEDDLVHGAGHADSEVEPVSTHGLAENAEIPEGSVA